jgi:hypothetical protein
MALAMPALAYALQNVRVGPSGAIIYAGPQPNARMTGTLRPGQQIRIYETPSAGYYRVAIGRRYVGWVQQTALDLPRPAAETPSASAPTIPAASPPETKHEPITSYLGLLGGLSLDTGQSNFGIAVDGGYKLSRFWNLGMYLQYISLSATSSSTSTSGSSSLTSQTTSKINLVMAAVEANYCFHQVPGLCAGAKGGLTMAMSNAVSTTTSNTGSGVPVVGPPTTTPTSANTSTFGVMGGLAVGYDYPVFWSFSVGAEANAFLLSGDITSNVVNLLATIKYIF